MDQKPKSEYFYLYNELYYFSLDVLHHLELFEDDATKTEKRKWVHFLDYRAGLANMLKKGKKDSLKNSEEYWPLKKGKHFDMYHELYNYLLEILSYLELFESKATNEEKDKWFNFLEYRIELAVILNKTDAIEEKKRKKGLYFT